jgi:hypothetical protein
LQKKDAIYHLTLHLNTTPEGKITALLDIPDQNVYGIPAIGGSFDGSHLTLRFFEWKPDSEGTLRYTVFSYEATVSPSGAELTGVLHQDGAWPLNYKRQTWQAKIPKSAPPTPVDGDWAGIQEGGSFQPHFILHISNTEDGLRVYLDCPEEKFKGALAHKVSYDPASRQISISFGPAVFAGKMSADGKALDTTMTEPGFHFVIHFDRLTGKQTLPN